MKDELFIRQCNECGYRTQSREDKNVIRKCKCGGILKIIAEKVGEEWKI